MMKPDFEGADHYFWRTISRDSIDNEKVTSIYTGINSIYLNPVVRSNFALTESIEIIRQVKQFYNNKNIEWCWYLSDKNKPNELGKYLEDEGLKVIEKTPKMSLS